MYNLLLADIDHVPEVPGDDRIQVGNGCKGDMARIVSSRWRYQPSLQVRLSKPKGRRTLLGPSRRRDNTAPPQDERDLARGASRQGQWIRKRICEMLHLL